MYLTIGPLPVARRQSPGASRQAPVAYTKNRCWYYFITIFFGGSQFQADQYFSFGDHFKIKLLTDQNIVCLVLCGNKTKKP